MENCKSTPYICWSYTAPTVTQEELDADKEALSEEEQRQIQADLYGIYEPIPELPDYIIDKTHKMNEHIDAIDEDDKESYLTAQEKCPEYCNSEDFRLMFLRADKFDAKQAAERFVVYWKEKEEIFGPERAFRRLSLDDMMSDPEDAELLKSGAIYTLPETDEAGRKILFVDRNKMIQPRFARASKMRVTFYMLQRLVEDDEITQRKGFVLVIAPPRDATGFDRKFSRRAFNLVNTSVPCRVAVYHLTVPDTTFVKSMFLPQLYHLVGKEIRNRLVIHLYQLLQQETCKTLEAYGIRKGIVPVELGGSFKFGARRLA